MVNFLKIDIREPEFAVYETSIGPVRIEYCFIGDNLKDGFEYEAVEGNSLDDSEADGSFNAEPYVSRAGEGCTACITAIKKVNTPVLDYGKACNVSDLAFVQIGEYLDGRRSSFDFPLYASGTVFQRKVWKALCDIPYGETRSYSAIANAVGSPGACRAVGNACNKNPLAFVVPCHRVVGSGGRPGGYAYGLELKNMLLNMEKKQSGPSREL